MSERELFEKIERVKDILSKYDWFFDLHSNQYVLESHSGDIKCLQASNYLDGLWYMWQARVPEGYVVVPMEPTEQILNRMTNAPIEVNHLCDNADIFLSEDEARIAYKAMLEAVEK